MVKESPVGDDRPCGPPMQTHVSKLVTRVSKILIRRPVRWDNTRRIRHQVSGFGSYFHLIYQLPPPTDCYSSRRPEYSEFRHAAGASTPILVLHGTCAFCGHLCLLSLAALAFYGHPRLLVCHLCFSWPPSLFRILPVHFMAISAPFA